MNLKEKHDLFLRDLASLLNRYGIDADCRTSDFILANYVCQCLSAFGMAREAQTVFELRREEGVPR